MYKYIYLSGKNLVTFEDIFLNKNKFADIVFVITTFTFKSVYQVKLMQTLITN